MSARNHLFQGEVRGHFLSVAKRAAARSVPNIEMIPEPKERLAALEKWAQEILSLGPGTTFADQAQNAVETYAVGVFEHLDPLATLPKRIRNVGLLIDAIRTAAPPKGVSHADLLRHHLLVLRVLNVSAIDIALRLVAAVWDLGIPERAVTEPIITSNTRASDELKAAVRTLKAACGEDQRRERHRVVHEGDSPSLLEVGPIHLIEEVQLMFEQELIPAEEIRAGFGPGITRITESIEREVKALETASGNLLTVLLPNYRRHCQLLSPHESDELDESYGP